MIVRIGEHVQPAAIPSLAAKAGAIQARWSVALKMLLCCVSFLLLAGCYSKIYVKPYAEYVRDPYVLVCGDLRYSGNEKYLPATVARCDGGEKNFVIEFMHEQDYTGTKPEVEMAMSMLPGYMLGLPTGQDKVLVYSRLSVTKDGKEVATYAAGCVKESYRSLYSGAVDNTEGRARCLELMTPNIENQMLRDEAFWKRTTGR